MHTSKQQISPSKITFDFFAVKILVRAPKLQKLTLQSMLSFKVLGLYHNTDGHSCNLHPACGIAVAVGDLVFVKKESSLIYGHIQDVGAIYWVVDSIVKCKVGFVPHVLSFTKQLDKLDNCFAIVKELYGNSSNPYKVLKDTNTFGMMRCQTVDNVANEQT